MSGSRRVAIAVLLCGLIASLPLAADADSQLVVSPDGKRMASVRREGSNYWVRCWDLGTRKLVFEKPAANQITSIAFSPDGKMMAWSANQSGKTTIVAADGTPIKELDTNSGPSVVFGADSKSLITGIDTVRIVALPAGTATDWPKPENLAIIASVSLSPDGKLLVTGHNDGQIRIWELASGKALATWDGRSQFVRTLRFSPDGKRIASVGDHRTDKAIKLWDTSGKLLATLAGHTDDVYALAWSSDGKRLASGSEDNDARIWDTTTNKLVRRIENPLNIGLEGAVFGKDGKTLYVSAKSAVKAFDTGSGKPVAQISDY